MMHLDVSYGPSTADVTTGVILVVSVVLLAVLAFVLWRFRNRD